MPRRDRESESASHTKNPSVQHGVKNPVKSGGNMGSQQGRVINPAGTKRTSVHRKPYSPGSEGY